MVRQLVQLFLATQGRHWKRKDNWLHGEPCVDGWYGISCCPFEQPFLVVRDANEQCCSNPTCLEGGTPAYRNGSQNCSSGLSTGTPEDFARCVVVSVDLSNNALNGSLDGLRESVSREECFSPGECGLTHVSFINLSHNVIHGSIPRLQTAFPSLRRVALQHNSFDFDVTSPALSSCFERTIACTGVPPLGCSAFGSSWRLLDNDRSRCHDCKRQRYVALLATTYVLVILISLALLTLWASLGLGLRNPCHCLSKPWASSAQNELQQSQAGATIIIIYLQVCHCNVTSLPPG